MKKADAITAWEFEGGRCLLGRLPHGKDLIASVEGFCVGHAIRTGVFSIIGSVTAATLGSYDQNQQVYVTFRREEALEIIHCTGNISLKDGKAAVHAHGVFADMQGKTVGGHLFSDTT
ncbi:MAG: PPC domain-containing DNA-binding protein, partial [Thermodesulfobacteriota bacterium]|nr:PPC domain-containing DNA-binding protein [Thermodesulfobacteriota bacterium]